jgi:hypothetical protein
VAFFQTMVCRRAFPVPGSAPFKRFHQGIQRLLVAAGFQGPVIQLLGRVHGFAKGKIDADAFWFTAFDVVEFIGEATG